MDGKEQSLNIKMNIATISKKKLDEEYQLYRKQGKQPKGKKQVVQ